MDDRELVFLPHSVERVPLPHSVEQVLKQICAEQKQKRLSDGNRRELASLDEDLALYIVRKVAGLIIQTSLDNIVCYFINKYRNQSPLSPTKSRTSDSPIRKLSFSPNIKTVPYFGSSQGNVGSLARSLIPEESPREEGQTLLEALGELDFRKQFLILSYSGGRDLQTFISIEDIRNWKHLPMVEFERQVWVKMGRVSIDRKDRQEHHDWDFGRTHIYHCHVSVDGFYTFKGPYLSKTRTYLQKVLGDDNVLLVKFAGETEPGNKGNNIGSSGQFYYSKIAREGILVGLRRYRFFVFKEGGKEEKKKDPTSSPVKCYFVRFESEALVDNNTSYILSNKTVSEARHIFMHACNLSSVSNYMARLSLILSKTYTMDVDLSSVYIKRVEDEYCLDESDDFVYRDGKRLIHTDGTGYISEDLAFVCPNNLSKGKRLHNADFEISNLDGQEDAVVEVKQQSLETRETPLLIQFRLFNNGSAVKGTFLVNKTLDPKTIWIRDSMIKVETDPMLWTHQQASSLEVVGTSNPPGRSCLSKILIALLSYGGVPDKFFLDTVDNALEEVHVAFSKIRAALRVSNNYGHMDDDFTAARMILSGIPLEESYLQYRLSILMKEERKGLRGGKLYVPECYYLMGTADPTGKLEKDEVCIVLNNGQVSGKVLVYRNPGLHFGDIHVLKATYVEELESYIGTAKYGIFFSRKGPRSIADEIAGGDFDGDMYWVSRNPQLLQHFKPSEPWSPPPSTPKVPTKKPKEFSDQDLEDELFKLFLTTRFEPSFTIGEAAEFWMAWMERLLVLGNDTIAEKDRVKEKIVRLINIYYDALDAPKKGGAKIEVPKDLRVDSFPHYMEKKRTDPSKSTSILGQIYNKVDEYQSEDYSNRAVWKLPSFDVQVPEPCLKKWKEYYDSYNEMCDTMQIGDLESKNKKADEMIKDFKKLLYGPTGELEDSTKNLKEIYDEALAIYNIVYDYAMNTNSVAKCMFAWRVAGSALFQIHIMKQTGANKPLLCPPSILRELF
ncbi:hypothetical protein UlMin_022174 [Ulmus minor]